MKGHIFTSAIQDFPSLKNAQGHLLPEVAIIGRSNVGKSSFINYLLGQKNLARTSAKPGKTQRLNFFLVDERFFLVDLPGYGFAKASKKEIQKWSLAIENYLQNRKQLKLLLLLIDARRGRQKEEEEMILWAKKQKIPLLFIFTKTDKLSRLEKKALEEREKEAYLYSISQKNLQKVLQKEIEKRLWD